MIRVASLGSGSRGNATVIECGATRLLIDCGFNLKTIEARAAEAAFDLSSLTAILVTHEHSDHIGGVSKLARRYKLPIYTTVGTWHAKPQTEVPQLNFLCSHSPVQIEEVCVYPVAVPHDAREPVQFVFEYDGLRFGVLTDLGSISAHVAEVVSDLDGLLIEFNHCVERLRTGSYPASLKRRVGGEFGHLNNAQALDFVQQLDHQRLQLLVAGHISEQNNCSEVVAEMLAPLSSTIDRIQIASQRQGFDWLEIAHPA
ncbi:MBL fold metallo-hydrolase [Umboniibacter marinipuniceus]|uniref:Phosphoribosyl 1,2-cyclic phosphodiesterase n=1 Tax=Umboniibacter marinipuniceus TaxID=569599 RepID=A0A3M0A3K9_9GAMM|nr:MBL fold metallo-hydrolase [Umboniibacter marinipuniceus]RMA79236.1 phosphoribosyl 1,2-cyclic phosphodiesterase [Umboniibacter marinipuniceus]